MDPTVLLKFAFGALGFSVGLFFVIRSLINKSQRDMSWGKIIIASTCLILLVILVLQQYFY
ncbi:MAG: hypothetical protein RJQ14_27630, partial [Marinoscillum sp.]